MATPIGHYLVGLALTESLARDPRARAYRYSIAAAACVPDLDVVPGMLVGELGRYHHHATHSVAAGAVLGLAVFLASRWGHAMPATVPLLVFAAYTSHHVLDALTANPGPRPGLPLLWPWSDARYLSPWPLLPNVQHTSGPLLSMHNTLLALRELALFAPLVAFVRAMVGCCPSPPSRAWIYGAGFLVVVALSVVSLNSF